MEYAYLDGRPVIIDGNEAWEYYTGRWHVLQAAEAHHKANLVSQAEFVEYFGHLPTPPTAARQPRDKPDSTAP